MVQRIDIDVIQHSQVLNVSFACQTEKFYSLSYPVSSVTDIINLCLNKEEKKKNFEGKI